MSQVCEYGSPVGKVVQQCQQGILDCCNPLVQQDPEQTCAFLDTPYETPDKLSWVVPCGVIASILSGFVLGTNEVALGVSVCVGSKILQKKQALILGALAWLFGAFSLSLDLHFAQKQFSGGESDCFACGYCDSRQALYGVGLLSTLVSIALTLLLSTILSLPITSSHALLGALVGVSLTSAGRSCPGPYPLTSLLIVLPSLLACLAASSLITFILYRLIKRWSVHRYREIQPAPGRRDQTIQLTCGICAFVAIGQALHTARITQDKSLVTLALASLIGALLIWVDAPRIILRTPFMQAVTCRLGLTTPQTARAARDAAQPPRAASPTTRDPTSYSTELVSAHHASGSRNPHTPPLDRDSVPSAQQDTSVSGRKDARPKSKLRNAWLSGSSSSSGGGVDTVQPQASGSKSRFGRPTPSRMDAQARGLDVDGEHASSSGEELVSRDDTGSWRAQNYSGDAGGSRGGERGASSGGAGPLEPVYSGDIVETGTNQFMQGLQAIVITIVVIKLVGAGANVTSNVAGPAGIAVNIPKHGLYECGAKGGPIWLSLLISAFIGIGAVTCGSRMVSRVGFNIAELDTVMGLSVELSGCIIGLLAAVLRLPVASVHCYIASIVVVGWAAAGRRAVRWRYVVQMIGAWLLTVPIASLINVGLIEILKLAIKK